jgi:RimJ/RimL family protein N-acetyltransferase
MPGHTNGSELTVHIRNALSMSKQELDQYETLVLKGGEVDAQGLRERIERASFLGSVSDGSRMVAVGAVKRPTQNHVREIGDKSGFNLEPYRGELGYLYVEPEYRKRHLCYRIIEGLLDSYADPVFATTRTDNTAIHRVLGKSGFVRHGSDWRSELRSNIDLCLWTRIPNDS